MSTKATITINGTAFTAENIKVEDGHVFVDGEPALPASGKIEIKIDGTLALLSCDGDLVIQGPVKGSVSAGGNVSCECVGGSVSAGHNVKCGRVGGSVSAAGSVRHA